MKTGATPATAPQARAGDSAQRPTARAKRRNQPRAGLDVKPDPRGDQGRPEPMCVSHAVDEGAAYCRCASPPPNDQLSSGRRSGKPRTPETNEQRPSAAAFGYPALARHLSLTLRLPRSAKTEHEDR